MTRTNTLITITGPTCAGKSTLEALLVKKGMKRMRSITTRPIRQGETQGKDYLFVTHDTFHEHITHDELAEHVEFNGNSYGVLTEDAMSALNESVAVVVVEPNGRMQWEAFAKRNGIRIIRIFVDNPKEVVYARFLQRFADDYVTKGESAIANYAQRMDTIQNIEWAWAVEAGYENHYDLVFNRFDETTTVPVLQSIMRLVDGTKETLAAA